MNKSKELKVAIEAAQEGGKILKSYFTKKNFHEMRKGDIDVITEADNESEQKIISILSKEFPEHQIFAEESGMHESKSEYKWIIDPLDGTLIFSRDFPEFAVSIALAKSNEIILGVVYNPMTDEMYYAEKGKCAYLNDNKISVSKRNKLIECMISTAIGNLVGEKMTGLLAMIKELAPKTKRFRDGGSASLNMCYIASGKLDGYWEMMLKPWDFAAGKIIVEEAGGKVTSGTEDDFDVMNPVVIATNGLIHNDIQKVVRKYLE